MPSAQIAVRLIVPSLACFNHPLCQRMPERLVLEEKVGDIRRTPRIVQGISKDIPLRPNEMGYRPQPVFWETEPQRLSLSRQPAG
jgi:hypothetical protein